MKKLKRIFFERTPWLILAAVGVTSSVEFLYATTKRSYMPGSLKRTKSIWATPYQVKPGPWISIGFMEWNSALPAPTEARPYGWRVHRKILHFRGKQVYQGAYCIPIRLF